MLLLFLFLVYDDVCYIIIIFLKKLNCLLVVVVAAVEWLPLTYGPSGKVVCCEWPSINIPLCMYTVCSQKKWNMFVGGRCFVVEIVVLKTLCPLFPPFVLLYPFFLQTFTISLWPFPTLMTSSIPLISTEINNVISNFISVIVFSICLNSQTQSFHEGFIYRYQSTKKNVWLFDFFIIYINIL